MPSQNEAMRRLKSATWLPVIAPFFEALDGEAGTTRAVGGIVRDTLLGIERGKTDFDFATQLLPVEVMARARRAGLVAHPTGIAHGTVTVVAGDVTVEVTTLRQDVETFGRHARVQFGTDWTADALRRDFTMNALYCGPSGELFDPLDGLADCLAGRVRFIGDADQRIAEDRLRVYRYFRFSASHGGQQFEHEALSACERAVDGLEALSAERVGGEMVRLLGLPQCAKTLQIMRDIGIMSEWAFSEPVIAAFDHLEALEVPVTATMRLSVIQLLVGDAEKLRDQWRLSNRDMAEIENFTDAATLAQQGLWVELAYRFSVISDHAIALAAAVEGRERTWMDHGAAIVAGLGPIHFPVSGKDLIARGFSGPNLGIELRRLETIWLESGAKLDRDALLARIG